MFFHKNQVILNVIKISDLNQADLNQPTLMIHIVLIMVCDILMLILSLLQVSRSVKALWQFVQKSQGLNSAALLDFGEVVSLQLGFAKVPTLRSNKTVKV